MLFNTMKRCRDEEDAQELEELRNEHKKPRVLPFRASPTTKHTLLFSQARSHCTFPKPPTLTPDLSSDEDESCFWGGRASQDANKYCTSSKQDTFSLQITAPALLAQIDEGFDSDVDMSDDTESLDSPASPRWGTIMNTSPASSTRGFSRPAPLSLSSSRQASVSLSSASTRIPTPIYGHFPSTSSVSPSSSTSPLTSPPPQPTTTFSRPVLPPLVTKPTFHDRSFFNHIQRRALPSPISEDESMDSPMTRTNTSFSKFHVQTPNPATPSPQQSPGVPQAAGIPGAAKDMAAETGTGLGLEPLAAASAGRVSEGRRGAVVNDSEGKKVVFSMGWRADCEKCRGRVPGHWSHVLRV